MHWKSLDLDPEQATAKDVKRAYARLLKQCRPDQNPEGFRQLHEAYQTALNELEWRSRSSGFPDSTATEEGQEPRQQESSTDSPVEISPAVSHIEISPGTASIMRTLDQLEDALKNNLPDVAERVRASEAALFEHPDEAPRWGDTLYRLIGIFSDHPDLRLKPEAMLFELEHHSVAATVAVIDRLDLKENREGISNLARLLLKHKDRIRTPAGGMAASRLACAAAFLAKGQVGSLSDFAYETLARGERDFHMQLIDRHVAISSLLADVPLSIRNFWRQRLLSSAGSEAWNDEASAAALRWLGSSDGRRSTAYEVLHGLLPEEVAAAMALKRPPHSQPLVPDKKSETLASGSGETFTWEAESPSAKPRETDRRIPHKSLPRRSSFSPLWLFGLPLVLLLRFCAADEPANTDIPINPPRLIRVEDLQPELYEESIKQKRSDSFPNHYLETQKKSKEKEFSAPGSAKGTDPSTNPYLKLLEGSSETK